MIKKAYFLLNQTKGPLLNSNLIHAVARSPPFRDVVQMETEGAATYLEHLLSSRKYDVQLQILQILTRISECGGLINEPLTGLDVLLTFLRKEATAKQFVTFRIERLLRQASAAVECLHHLKLQPWWTTMYMDVHSEYVLFGKRYLPKLTGDRKFPLDFFSSLPLARPVQSLETRFYDLPGVEAPQRLGRRENARW